VTHRPADHLELELAIRAHIDDVVMHPTSTFRTLQLADALRAILDWPKLDRGEGYSTALTDTRLVIGLQWGLIDPLDPK
jgi:hypothetical protein